MGQFWRRATYWLRRRRLHDELQEELETHRALREDALSRAGDRDSAAASRRALGNTALALDDARDVWIWPWIDSVFRDIRHAMRGLRRRPGFALTAVLTIAIGSGALASVLSVVHAVLLRPAPYPNAARIVQIEQELRGRSRDEVSAADILALREGSPSLARVSLAWFSEASIAGGALPDRARLVYTDWQAFEILGTAPLMGRLPSEADEAPSATAPVVVIGHRLWTLMFASDPDIVGRLLDPLDDLRVDGASHIFAAGDAAIARTDEQGHHTLMACQHALVTGRYAGHNAARDLLGLATQAYRQPDYVTCLDLGGWGAVFTQGWRREVSMAGAEAKALKNRINREWIYPPAPRRALLLAAAHPDKAFG